LEYWPEVKAVYIGNHLKIILYDSYTNNCAARERTTII